VAPYRQSSIAASRTSTLAPALSPCQRGDYVVSPTSSAYTFGDNSALGVSNHDEVRETSRGDGIGTAPHLVHLAACLVYYKDDRTACSYLGFYFASRVTRNAPDNLQHQHRRLAFSLLHYSLHFAHSQQTLKDTNCGLPCMRAVLPHRQTSVLSVQHLQITSDLLPARHPTFDVDVWNNGLSWSWPLSAQQIV
jgi:hypothetical protein